MKYRYWVVRKYRTRKQDIIVIYRLTKGMTCLVTGQCFLLTKLVTSVDMCGSVLRNSIVIFIMHVVRYPLLSIDFLLQLSCLNFTPKSRLYIHSIQYCHDTFFFFFCRRFCLLFGE
jgi:hypothetical protein